MEHVIASVLVGLLLAYIGLRIRWKIREGRCNKVLRNLLETPRDTGEMNVCRWFVGSDGEWGRVRVSIPGDDSKAASNISAAGQALAEEVNHSGVVIPRVVTLSGAD